MELEQQIKKIEKIKSDSLIQMILVAAKQMLNMTEVSENLMQNHFSRKNKTIDNKIRKFSEDIVETLDPIADKYVKDAEKTLIAFCGFDEDLINNIHFYTYLLEDLEIDEWIEHLKIMATNISKYKFDVTQGHTLDINKRIVAIEQLKNDTQILSLLSKIFDDDDSNSTFDELCDLITDKISLPGSEVFEAMGALHYEYSIDELISDLIMQTKDYIANNYAE